MFDDGKQAIEEILALVKECPKDLQEKCFEVLLQGYVNSRISPTAPAFPPVAKPPAPASPLADDQHAHSLVPESVRPRFTTTAKRLKVPADRLASLFDFTVEPFAFHALSVPGGSKAAKMRNVALLVAVRSYLIDGRWRADWAETQAMGIDQNCYDRTNISKHFSHDYFTSAAPTTGILLSGEGQKAAEALLTKLAGGAEE